MSEPHRDDLSPEEVDAFERTLMDTDNRDPISNLRAIAAEGSALDLVQVERGNLRALVAEHRCLEASPGVVGERDRLREALKPFAAMADYLDNTAKSRDAIYCGGDPGIRCEVKQSDYHRARAALNNTGGQSDE